MLGHFATGVALVSGLDAGPRVLCLERSDAVCPAGPLVFHRGGYGRFTDD